jgi:Ca2+/H+ antiporter
MKNSRLFEVLIPILFFTTIFLAEYFSLKSELFSFIFILTLIGVTSFFLIRRGTKNRS